MTLVSAAWRPCQLDFTAPGLRECFHLGEIPKGVEIAYPHGNVVVEVKNGTLAIKFPLVDRTTPTLHMSVTYRRLSNTSPMFYPEILVTTPGKPELIPRL